MQALADGFKAGSHVGSPIHVHQAVRAPAGAAQQPTRAMVLEATTKDAYTGGVESRSNCVTSIRGDLPPSEGERHVLRAVNFLRRVGRKPAGVHKVRVSPFLKSCSPLTTLADHPLPRRSCARCWWWYRV